MPLYESVFIMRQDISSTDVDKLVDSFAQLVKEHKGTVIKNEYWGLRSLAYEIDNNKKGHYVMLGMQAEPSLIKELERKMKLNADVIRFMTHNVKEISKEPSIILSANQNEMSVDVTTNNNEAEKLRA